MKQLITNIFITLAGKKTEFYEQYVKEVEYRCGRQLDEDDKQENDDK